MNKGTKKKNKALKKSKNGVLLLENDQDFLAVFENHPEEKPWKTDSVSDTEKQVGKNRHGMPVIDNIPGGSRVLEDKFFESAEEDFETLLDEYYKKQEIKPLKKPDPVPLKKRLKRYPPVEVALDLHGCDSIQAGVKLASFLQTCKRQGIFTTRIVVGKGLHSDEGPVLPGIVEDLLHRLKGQDLVLWYEWDKKKKLQSGSVIVYIKQFD